MIDFLLGFVTADLVISLLLIKRIAFLNLDSRLILNIVFVDFLLLLFLILLKYGKLKKS